ncbi:LysM peptidoglycan-binding domain-containing protein [Paenibacillus sp. 481]|uniref:LysM peptidoglycan-binding domain-containing protein n=1 Tax=Paenibacillus sp. 481 TaxID=2835869 RepID=UPI001E5F10A2|nr:LysM peptidoglycan-binding domain-containing protein [Paenibacillus sp. 481]UHA74367.1 LysM peptidoglycan-binding domain-containing protein [Paenibacillus sp. 481]
MHDQSNGLRFDIYERVHLSDDVIGIDQLEEVELTPHIQVIPAGDQVTVRGSLLLAGVYVGATEERRSESLEHWIPVEITLPLNRVRSLEDISVDIEHFDIDLLSTRSLNVTGVLSLRGIYMEVAEPTAWEPEQFTVVHQAEASAPGIDPEWIRDYGQQSVDMSYPIGESYSSGHSVEYTPEHIPPSSHLFATELPPVVEPDKQVPAWNWSDSPWLKATVASMHAEPAAQAGHVHNEQETLQSAEHAVEQSELYPSTDPPESCNTVEHGRGWQHEHVQPADDTLCEKAPDTCETAPDNRVEQHDSRNQPQQTVTSWEAWGRATASSDNNASSTSDAHISTSSRTATGDITAEVIAELNRGTARTSNGHAHTNSSTANNEAAARYDETSQGYDDGATPSQLSDEQRRSEHADDYAERLSEYEQGSAVEEQTSAYAVSKPEMKVAIGSVKSSATSTEEQLAYSSLLHTSRQTKEREHLADITAQEYAASQDAARRNSSDRVHWQSLFLNRVSDESAFKKVRMCIVQREDTLDTIADRYQINSREIALYNRLSEASVIEGQVLYIPS